MRYSCSQVQLQLDSNVVCALMAFLCFRMWARKGIIGMCSKTGYKELHPGWQCQDAYAICRGFNEKRDQAFFGVFDGHGEFGKEVSNACAEQVMSNKTFHIALI